MRKFAIVSVLIFFVLSTGAFAGGDWPHPRGPATDGTTGGGKALSGETVGLKPAWRVALGSGYSGISVADGKVVTGFAEGEFDWVGAFDAASGRSLWKTELGPIHKGHDGSDDGPLSSPVIGDGTVFALAPRGRLIALRLGDGSIVWEKQLAEALGAKEPSFGFTSTPLYADGTLVVQAGGTEGRSLVGLDAEDGSVRWSHGEGSVAYQSPALMTLVGRLQIVAFDTSGIVGVDPADGAVLWRHAVAEDDRIASIVPTPLGEDRFLVFQAPGAAAYRVSKTDAGFAVEEVYRTNALGNGYAAPVVHDGHVYGFRGQVLTCVDAATGERVWRSRPPGGDGLIAVDGRLIVFASQGNVVVADATPEGYREVARAQALGGSSLTWPSYADGRVFVRNLEELAAVAVTRTGQAVPRETTASLAPEGSALGRLLADLGSADDRAARIDAFLEAHPTMPIVEGRTVQFVYRGKAEDVAIAGSMLDDQAPAALHRVEGADLFVRAFDLEPGGRWEYQFQVDFGEWIADPLNPRTVPEIEGEGKRSEVVTPGYALGAHVAEPTGPRGTLETWALPSEKLEETKEVRVWLPPGYASSERSYPLLVVNDGEAWVDKGRMVQSLDNLVGSAGYEPIVVAFVPATGRWWLEAGGGTTDEYVAMLAGELVPALKERYRLTDRPAAILGNRFFGVSAALAALRHPDVFDRVAVQSVFLDLGKGDELREAIREGTAKGVAFYVDWSPYDERSVDRDWSMTGDSRELFGLLQASGYAVRGGEVLDSAGWGGWRNRTDRVLRGLFPEE